MVGGLTPPQPLPDNSNTANKVTILRYVSELLSAAISRVTMSLFH